MMETNGNSLSAVCAGPLDFLTRSQPTKKYITMIKYSDASTTAAITKLSIIRRRELANYLVSRSGKICTAITAM
jgi:hypothetical protein